MKIKTYNKLVRDNIPEIIRSGGNDCVTEVLSEGDYLRAIDSKLSEEMKEYTDSHEIEELADILEVVYAAAAARGVTRDTLEKIRAEKHRKNGGFSKKLFLKEFMNRLKEFPEERWRRTVRLRCMRETRAGHGLSDMRFT